MKILLAGATGLVGGHALTQLLADPACSAVIAPTRRALELDHPKLHNPVLDFDALPAQASWWQVQAAICALGTTMRQAGSREAFRRVDHDYPLAIARLLRQHGAEAFALNSALRADPQSWAFYNRVKGDLENDLRALDYPSLTLVRPGLIGGERAQRRRGEHAASVVLRALGPLLPRRYRINPAERIAAALVAAVLQPRPGVQVIDAAQLV
ncbi:NAD-dependent dehydratase [Xanthomonas rydalmerensis]|uniref:NAD-dependent dehydratase n=1 Tax=Xanthomonas rydalmerensis TaxID=3046274 RepID=A0ABZ0JNS7_9XANT|nr:NAD-dependent dehydratase [Xanthomonas sp. DM-2023]WOS41454.1 NAD-dependent dehydratase [Xanthomonas sp. DM-2023]WOS45639.1 NAD-dependent dehydratase [Xanthomonas sp. DM-2023]WOS49818.1 NAD-dependent dehydratase [Xanthomonas sp. DM-2023]WOS53998.1 NAD-dependent dehydratase [Xanthomonas sp. DM-2023]WOS58181.1 NAD-dependent dehydratase [Xanthomonas sp. DM-2023]